MPIALLNLDRLVVLNCHKSHDWQHTISSRYHFMFLYRRVFPCRQFLAQVNVVLIHIFRSSICSLRFCLVAFYHRRPICLLSLSFSSSLQNVRPEKKMVDGKQVDDYWASSKKVRCFITTMSSTYFTYFYKMFEELRAIWLVESSTLYAL